MERKLGYVEAKTAGVRVVVVDIRLSGEFQMVRKSDRSCWRQVWADGRAVVYVRDLATLKKLKKQNGRWWAPVGKPTRCIAPKGARIR